jgi:hypothetical protein
MGGSILIDAWARPTYYYDPEVGDYVEGNPPDGYTEYAGNCADCCDECRPLKDVDTVSLVISGISFCGCWNFTPYNPLSTIKSFSQTVSVTGGTLTGVLGSGNFTLTVPNAVEHRRYTDLDCVTPYPIENPSYHDLVYQVICAGGTVSIYAQAPSFGLSYFVGSGTLEAARTTGLSNSNSTSCSSISVRSSGGTATISF